MQTLDEVPRDRWSRPLIIPPEGGKPVPYTRCTTYVGALEDTYNLEKWKMRQVAVGLSSRPDLVMAVQACGPDDKSAVDAHCQTALDVAQSSAAANIGTALHKFTEQHDYGTLDMTTVPELYRPDIKAYAEVMRQAKLRVQQVETFVVNDAIKVGGTFDRTVAIGGKMYVLDVKTGSIDYGMGKIAMQLAVYAHSRHYDPATGQRTDLDVDLERAIVAHLPAGTGKCFLRWVDIATGWEGVHLAGQVRAWRALKNLSEPMEYVRVEPELSDGERRILDQIAAAATLTALNEIWHTHKSSWTPALTEASKARKATLTTN